MSRSSVAAASVRRAAAIERDHAGALIVYAVRVANPRVRAALLYEAKRHVRNAARCVRVAYELDDPRGGRP